MDAIRQWFVRRMFAHPKSWRMILFNGFLLLGICSLANEEANPFILLHCSAHFVRYWKPVCRDNAVKGGVGRHSSLMLDACWYHFHQCSYRRRSWEAFACSGALWIFVLLAFAEKPLHRERTGLRVGTMCGSCWASVRVLKP